MRRLGELARGPFGAPRHFRHTRRNSCGVLGLPAAALRREGDPLGKLRGVDSAGRGRANFGFIAENSSTRTVSNAKVRDERLGQIRILEVLLAYGSFGVSSLAITCTVRYHLFSFN